MGIILAIFGYPPKTELKMALAGPGVSFLIYVISIIIFLSFKPAGESFMDYLFLSPINNPYLRLIWIISILNFVLGIFNLLPAFPMDGGRVLRAWLAERTSYIRVTRKAAGIGKGKMFAIFMGFFGLFYNFWFILIEERRVVKVSQIMTKIL